MFSLMMTENFTSGTICLKGISKSSFLRSFSTNDTGSCKAFACTSISFSISYEIEKLIIRSQKLIMQKYYLLVLPAFSETPIPQ